MNIRHLGTERSPEVLDAMRVWLLEQGVTVRTDTAAARILVEDGRVTGVELADGEVITAGSVIAAPGPRRRRLAHRAGARPRARRS